MSNTVDLKKLWGKQEIAAPDTKELFHKTKAFKKKSLKKIILTNILLLLTCAFIASIWYREQPQMITTGIGTVFVILAMIIYLLVYNQMIPLLMKIDEALDNSRYLQQFLKIKAKQLFLQNTMLNSYFLLLSTGIFLYMIEPVSQMMFGWAIFSYAITLAWLSFAWLVLRPRKAKSQNAKINELIGKFEALNKQLAGNE